MRQPLMLILRGEQGVSMGLTQVCVYRHTRTFSSDLDGRVFLCPLPRLLKKSASGVLASLRPSTGTRPPHHSAARTDLVLLIRRTVRPRGYVSGLRSLRPRWTAFLSILKLCRRQCHTEDSIGILCITHVFPQPESSRGRIPLSLRESTPPSEEGDGLSGLSGLFPSSS